MTVQRCPHCNTHIEWLSTKFGKRLPFNFSTVPVDPDLFEVSWIPAKRTVRGRETVVMSPILHVSAAVRERVLRVLLVHSCEGYRARVQAATAEMSRH